jgi:tetratricopeptide (TPR) repeat protein
MPFLISGSSLEVDPSMRALRCFPLLLFALSIVACERDVPQRAHDQTDVGDRNADAAVASSITSKDESAGNHTATKRVDQAKDATLAMKASSAPAEHSVDREQWLDRADRAARRGEWERASELLKQVLTVDPSDAEATFRMAQVRAGRGDLPAAISLLESIPEDHPEAGLPALGQSADWCLRLDRYAEAEQRYRTILQRVPKATAAHRQLAWLLNRQGRRHEAAVHLKALCELGDIREDELHGLMVVSHAMFTAPGEPPPSESARPYYPIGPVGYARYDFTHGKFRRAAERLEKLFATEDSRSQPATVQAFYGRLLAESQQDARFLQWLESADASWEQHAEFWAALGAYLLRQRDFKAAVRALAEAIDRDPTDPLSIRRINQALLAVGRAEQAKSWKARYALLNQTAHAASEIAESPQPRSEAYATVVDGLNELGRPLEALTWELFEALHRKSPRSDVDQIVARRRALLQSDRRFPSQTMRLCGLDLERFPLPQLDALRPARSSTAAIEPPVAKPIVPARFENVADSVGLTHQYEISDGDQQFAFALYQTLGGGVVVFDYDLNGRSDLYFAQGGGEPGQRAAMPSNKLFRAGESRLREVTAPSRTTEPRYTLGVTAGDWNQDGFPDLAVASIGGKALFINQGDGTFLARRFDADQAFQRLPTSLAIADLTGDALPDLVGLHDVDDPTMRDKPTVQSDGSFEDAASPLAFDPGTDQVWINDGTGGFDPQPLGGDAAAPSTGLGIVVAELDGQPGNEVFVGNDMRPNQWWVRDRTESADGTNGTGKKRIWNDLAAVSGCSHDHGGTSTASMGIAAADFDGNGSLDLHVTNFFREPVSLFMNEQGMFADQSVSWRLSESSIPMLGFGSQPIDYDNDGDPDLAVTNGHVDQLPGQPFRQPPQFFVNQGSHFKSVSVKDGSGYWSSSHLGRAMARLDFNRDGRSDLVVTHIGSPSALLINRSESDHHWSAIRLVGTKSERDAIGARVTIHCGDQRWTQWSIAGDGYLCRNEATLHFGLQTCGRIDELIVHWPDGTQQRHRDLSVDREWLVVEGQDPTPQ